MLNVLGVDACEIIVVELVGESSDGLSKVHRLRVKDQGEAVPYGDTIFVHQSSMSPVAPA